MSSGLSLVAERFLAGERFATISAIRTDKALVPAEAGIYGWWFDSSMLADVSEKILSRDGLRLLYIGIAPSAAPRAGAKARTLRDRLVNHCQGPIAVSTLRRTIVALIRSQEGFEIERTESGKQRITSADEARLTEWMDAHARVTWLATLQPWLVEDELLRHGPRLPLNIKGSTDPFRFELKKLRAQACKIAHDNGDYPTDPRRFYATAQDIKPLGRFIQTVDHLTDQQRAQNAEHDRIVEKATRGLHRE